MSARLQFWLLQSLGWSAFVVALLLPWLGAFPLGGMLVAKAPLVGAGIAATLLLRALYRMLLRRGMRDWMLAVVVCGASYVAAVAWSTGADLISRTLLHDSEHVSLIRLSFDRFGGTWYCALVLAAWSLLYLGATQFRALTAERERRMRSDSLAREARLEALRYQVNPHFLFNTLNAISTLVVEVRTSEAAGMISRLSEFLRQTLSGDGEAEIALADEVRFASQYLEIERVRFGERLVVLIDVDSELETLRVPALILLPIVENAVRHAVERNERGGRVTIRARRDDGALRLTVIDDGPGHSAMPIAGAGIGLANTRARLHQLFGSHQALHCTCLESGGRQYDIEIPAQGALSSRRTLAFA
jgi:signal transduction histidine kinase